MAFGSCSHLHSTPNGPEGFVAEKAQLSSHPTEVPHIHVRELIGQRKLSACFPSNQWIFIWHLIVGETKMIIFTAVLYQ